MEMMMFLSREYVELTLSVLIDSGREYNDKNKKIVLQHLIALAQWIFITIMSDGFLWGRF